MDTTDLAIAYASVVFVMRTIQNIDVNGITEKVWKWGWSFSLGLSFNIAK